MEIDPLWVLVCIGIPLFGIAIFLWGLRSERKKSAKKIEDVKSRYQDSLAELRLAPDNQDAMQKTLRLGKEYAGLVQFDKRDDFDEVALLQDLNAARSGLPPLKSIDEAGPEKSLSPVEQQLAELQELRDKGVISQAEYHEKTVKIFGEI